MLGRFILQNLKLRTLCLFVLLIFTCSAVPAIAQTGQDFSDIRVDELSDAQIQQFMNQMESSGLSQLQLEQVAQSRGMSLTEIQKLRQRVNQIRGTQPKTTNTPPKGTAPEVSSGRIVNNDLQAYKDSLQSEKVSVSAAERSLIELRSHIFGADLFSTNGLTFEPNLRLATPGNYQVGPDDELLIDIYGYSEASYQLKVSPEGTINVPYVGVVPVSGMTIEQATSRLKSRLSKIYSGLQTGNTSLSVTLGNIRSIKVILTGEVVKPGTYTLPSLATVFNALYSSGGPTENGSFRQIELIRAGRRFATLDVYDFLLNGEFKNNVRLQDQDVIRIPTYKKRVEIIGSVKRPGIYELKSEETLSDALRFSGGFTERAYQARVKVLSNTKTERRVADITEDNFVTYQPNSGDKYYVNQILDRFENRVTIQGAVFRPGPFELTEGLTVSKLIRQAEGLREDAFLNRGYITRLTADNHTELLSFDVAKVLSGDIADIPLQREDEVSIPSVFELKEAYIVRVDGEVRAPRIFPYSEKMTLQDAIVLAGGLKESASSKRVEVSRRVVNSDITSESAKTAQVFEFNIDEEFKRESSEFILQPFDIVIVRPAAGYILQKQVRVQGEVLSPGIYTLTKKDERISDVLKRAGGFSAYAYPEGASLQRLGALAKDTTSAAKKIELDRQKQFVRLQDRVADTTGLNIQQEAVRNNFVGINLPKILKKPGRKEDIFLEDGDVITIPQQLQTIKVSGEVLSPVTVIYTKGKLFCSYLSNAGGFSDKAHKRRAYIVYANGLVESNRRFLFFNNYPAVKPGAEIFVPRKAEGRRMSIGEVVGLTSGLASLAAIMVALFR